MLEIDETGIQISGKMSEDLSADIIIDFSSPKSSMEILQLAKKKEIPILIGTTGFSEENFKEIEIARLRFLFYLLLIQALVYRY